MNLTGSSLMILTQSRRKLCLQVGSKHTRILHPDVDKLIFQQSKESDKKKRRKLVCDIEKLLVDDGARPIIDHKHSGTCGIRM